MSSKSWATIVVVLSLAAFMRFWGGGMETIIFLILPVILILPEVSQFSARVGCHREANFQIHL